MGLCVFVCACELPKNLLFIIVTQLIKIQIKKENICEDIRLSTKGAKIIFKFTFLFWPPFISLMILLYLLR